MNISQKTLIERLSPHGRSALEGAAGLCVGRTHYDVEVEHFLSKLLERSDGDVEGILAHFDVDRARLTADGVFYTCLFAAHGTDLRELVRSHADTATLQQRISGIWETRTDRYSEHRNGRDPAEIKVEMYRLGG